MKSNRVVHVIAGVVCAGVPGLGACGGKPALRPNLTDAQYSESMQANFTSGMTRAQVEAKLDSIGTDSTFRHWYPHEKHPGGQLLQRVFEKGGLWIGAGDESVEWIDTWFVFAPNAGGAETLERWYTQRGSQRYFEFEPINAPPESETAGPTRRSPAPPPPPRHPPERM